MMKANYVKIYTESVRTEMIVADNDDLEILKAVFDKILRDRKKNIEPIKLHTNEQ